MKYISTLVFLFIFISWNVYSQDTVRFTGTQADFWIDYYDSIETTDSKTYCWRREEFSEGVLFSIEYLTQDRFFPIKDFSGYYPNGNLAFKRTYFFDGLYSEISGVKELFFENGKIKERGFYQHGIKCGVWTTYNSDGSLKLLTQYESKVADTISSFSYLTNYRDKIINDTLTFDTFLSFYDLFPCISFGKNGIEVVYQSGKQVEVRKYEFGKLVLSSRKKNTMKKLIRNSSLAKDHKINKK